MLPISRRMEGEKGKILNEESDPISTKENVFSEEKKGTGVVYLSAAHFSVSFSVDLYSDNEGDQLQLS